ncbi:hypothetical protein [Mariniflexile sp.]|uniref:hypothetical protein n=1 Tax=Mariniflexile sp. TaxID=1979402 RepID=UPI0040487541
MKTLTLFFLIVFTTILTVNAQLTKGNWMVGGDVSFTYSQGKSDIAGKTFTVTGSPNIGYFFFNKIAAGAKVNYTFSESKFERGTSEFERLLIAPFARYYFLEVDKPVNVFLESAYRYAILNENNSTEFSLKGGVAIFLNSSVALEVSLNYLNSKSKNEYVGSQDLLLGFGIQVNLEKP